jgi:nitrite reductase/ring-hydroxylating ferredoxin subunit
VTSRHQACAARTERVLCPLSEIEDGQGRGFTLGEGNARREIFVLRAGARVYGYVNSCPHQGTPLDWVPDRFVSTETGLVLCATHGAMFRVEDGYCVAGPCAGQALRRVPVRVDAAGRVILDDG